MPASEIEEALTRATWRKSTFSNNGGECVEVAKLDTGQVAVRDSKNPGQAPLVFTHGEWKAFAEGMEAGEFD